jgi:hypothetical protein
MKQKAKHFRNRPRPPCSFRQVYAITRTLLSRDPSLLRDTVEWKEQTKDAVSRLGYQTPTSAVVYRAMNALELVQTRRGAPHQRYAPRSRI